MLQPGFIGFCWFLAAIGGFFGSLRATIVRNPRVWVLPVATLVFLLLMGVVTILLTNKQLIYPAYLIGSAGYTAALFPMVYLIATRDFAKAIPAWVCKSCGYPLLGLTDPLCPECGTPFNPDKVPGIVPDQIDPAP